jgi:SAM-dependent methyltransferase
MEAIRQEVIEEWRRQTQSSEQRTSDVTVPSSQPRGSNETLGSGRDLSSLVRLHEIRETRQMGKTIRLRSIRRMLHREIEDWLLQDRLARQVNFNLEAISVIKDLSATLEALQQEIKNETRTLRGNLFELSREHEQTRHNIETVQQNVSSQIKDLRDNLSELSREHEQTRHNIETVQQNVSSQIKDLKNMAYETATERKKTNDQIHLIDGRITSLETEGTEQIARSKGWLSKIDVASLAYTDPKTHGVFSERFVEYVWVLENLIRKGKILEVGCVESELPQVLSEYPDLEVYGIDTRPYMNPRFKFFLEDARSTRFGNGTFDQVLCVSSIEHFGLLWYGETQLDPEADVKAAREIYRILKPSATLILTVPFGTGSPNWYRTYNTSTLSNLLHGYEITRSRFYAKLGSIWLPSPRAEAEKADCHESTHGLACILAHKPTRETAQNRQPVL